MQFLLNSKAVQISGDRAEQAIERALGMRSERLTPKQAYYLNGWFRRCVEDRAEALGALPYTVSRGERVLYDTSGFEAVPNELVWFADAARLLKMTEAALVIRGQAYWRPIVAGRRMTEIEWMSPDLVEPLYGERGEVVRYRRTLYPVPGRATPFQREYPADEVVAFFEADPFVEVGPGSPVGEAARVNADVLNALDRFLDSYMDRGLLPSTILAVPSNTSPEERAKFQQWWSRYFRGADRAGEQRVLNADAVTVQKIGDGIADLGASEVVKQQREAIAVSLGVPMSRLLPGTESRGNAMMDDQGYYTKIVIPRAKRIEALVNRHIFAPQGLFFQFQYKRIEALQRSLLETARGVQRLVEGPIWTQNEGRLFMGSKPKDDPRANELGDLDDLDKEASTLAVQESTSRPEERRRTFEDELALWRRKVEKKGFDAPFICHATPPSIEAEIRRRLGRKDSEAFAPPYLEY